MPRFTVVMAVVAYEEGVEEKVPYRMSFNVVASTRYDAVNHLAQSIRKVADASVFEPRVPSTSVVEVNPVANVKAVADAMVSGLTDKEREILRKRFENMPEAMAMGWMFTKPKDSDCHNCGGDGYTMDEPKCPACKGTGKEASQPWCPPDAGVHTVGEADLSPGSPMWAATQGDHPIMVTPRMLFPAGGGDSGVDEEEDK